MYKNNNNDNKNIRKVFLDKLPKKGKKQIDWYNSIGYIVPFIFNGIEGTIQIINVFKDNKNNTVLKTLYNNKEYNIMTNNFKKGAIGSVIGKITSDFKIEIGQTFKDDKRDIIITDRKREQDKNGIERKYYKYQCNKCGFDCGEHYKKGEYQEEYWISESSLLNSTGCACCCPTPRIVVTNINSIYKTDPWMTPIVGEDVAKRYTCFSEKMIYPICPDCGNIRKNLVRIGHIKETNSIGCESCGKGEKYPNKFMYNLLSQLYVIFQREYSPKWIKPRAYDFYFKLNNREYIIEMDGGFHFKDNNMSGQTKEESQAIDNYKDEQAKLHGIEVIRIDCDYGNDNKLEYIKQNILNDKRLNNLFNLSMIDWNKCNQYAINNLAKIACEYKKNNPEMTTTEIGKIMGYSPNTICIWLKQGDGVWCNYNVKEERIKTGVKLGKNSSKPIICIETGQIFESATECQRLSLQLFGIQLWQDKISAVCRGKIESTKGFHFKFI